MNELIHDPLRRDSYCSLFNNREDGSFEVTFV